MFGPQLPFFKLDRLKRLFGVLPRLPIRGREASRPARPLLLECLEDRLTPATATLVGPELQVRFDKPESVTVANNSGQILVFDGVSTFQFPAANVNRLTVTDPSNSPNQLLTFTPSNPLNLANGIASIDVESVAINNAISSGSISINTLNISSNSNGSITLLTAAATFTTNGAGALTGAISGPGSVSYVGIDQLFLSGNNNYSGGTSVTSGTVVAAAASALGSGSVSVTNQGSLGIQGSVTLNNDITIDTNGPAGRIVNFSGANTIQGAINANGNGALKFDMPTGSLIIAGTFNGTSPVSKLGPGTLTYNGSNKTYTKDTTITDGTLVANVSVSSANVLVNSGGTLAGSGPLLGAVRAFAGGTIAPGAGGPGRLDTGPLVLFSNSFLKIDLNGTSATPPQYDQVNVVGAVNLNLDGGPGATLDVTLAAGFTPPAGSSYLIINNDGGVNDPIQGTFANLAQGATLTVNGFPFTISYTGGDGNDVVLSRPPTVNNPPVAQPGSLTTAEDTANTGTLQATDSDSPSLTYSIVDATNAHGTVTITPGTRSYTYTPDQDFNGPASFTFQANDGNSNSNPATISITVTPVNDAPAGVNDTLSSISEDSLARTIAFSALTGNDIKGPANEGGQNLTITAVSGAVGGVVSIVAPNVIFTPAADFNGVASFSYTLADDGTTNGAADPKTSTAIASFTITEVNDAPAGVNDTLSSFPEDSLARTIAFTALTGNDIKGPANENSQSLTITAVSGVVGGTVSIVSPNLVFTPAADFNGVASFTYTLADDGTTNGAVDPKTSTATVSFTITEVNDSPTGVNDTLTSIPQNSPARTIPFTSLTGNDVRGPANESAQNLTITTVSGPVGGTLSFSGQNVVFTPTANFTGPASFTYTLADDGTTNGAPDPKTSTALVTFNIDAVNTAPVASDGSLTTFEDTPATGTLVANDADGGTLTYSIVTPPSTTQGTVALTGSAPGAYSFTPAPHFNGTASFTFKANDGALDSTPATITITVIAVNDAPTGMDDSLPSIEEDSGPRTIAFTSLTANDMKGPANESGQNLTITAVSGAVGGTVSILGTTVIFMPAANFNGAARFTYTLADDGTTNGAADPKTSTAVASFTITPVNDLPVASDGVLSTPRNTPATGMLIATDVDNTSLTYSLVTAPSQGSVSVNATTGAYSFTPLNNFIGTTTFTFKANDGAADSNTATIMVTVFATNVAPVAKDATFTTAEDAFFSGLLTATDADNQSLFYSIVTPPSAAQGTVVITNTATGAFSFNPAVNFNGPVSFTFRASDGALDSNIATVVINVAPVNDAPIAGSATVSTEEDKPINGTLGAIDFDNNPLTFSIVAAPAAAQGTVTIIDATKGTFLFTPALNFNGQASFTFKANDGIVDSNVATMTVNVTPVNDAPVAKDGALTTGNQTATGTLIATDVDNANLTYSIVAPPNSNQGTVAITNAATGAYSFTPFAGFTGQTSFTFKANDGALDSNVATITITVLGGVNVAPVAANGTLTTAEDTTATGTLTATDANGDKPTFSIVTPPAATQGTVVITNAATGAYNFTPAPNFNGQASFTFKANDGAVDSNIATITITVAPVNDAPVANNGTLNASLNSQASGTLSATDIDSPSLIYSIVSPANAHGVVTITNAATGAFNYTPDKDFVGSASFTFKANDGASDSNFATVTITVSAGNFATTTVVTRTAGANPSTYGDPLTFRATVTNTTTTAAPTGFVNFFIDNATTPIGVPLVLGANNTATASFTISALAASATPHAISAVYVANGNFTGSQGGLVGGQTVNRRSASVTPNDATKVVGTADPVLTGTLSGFVPTDNVTATYSRAPGETVQGSPYTISVAALSPQNVLSNYNITLNTGKFTITPVATADVAVGVVGDRLQVTILTPGRTVLVSTINGVTTVAEDSIGIRSFPTSSYNQFNAADLTNSPGSTLTFAGNSLLTLSGGLTSNNIDRVAFNSPISTTTLSITAKDVNSGANGTINVSTSATFNISGSDSSLLGDIKGTGSLTKNGTGTLILNGNNAYTGVTNVNAGVLTAPTKLALGSTAGVNVAPGATLGVRGDIVLNAPLNLSGAGVGGVGALNNMFGINTFAGPITLAANTVIGSETGALTLPGVISGAANLTKTGPGRVVLSGESTYTGVTNVNQGELIVDGSIKSSPVVNVNNGGLLGGKGTVGNINAFRGGKVSPGNSPGKSNSGNLNMYTGAFMIMDINGTIVGTDYDQVNVSGNVDLDADDLGGATLDVNLGYTPVAGDKFIIINNNGIDPIVDDFAGMPQGSVFNESGASLYISYTGGDGNDVELTVVAPTDMPSGTILTASPQHTTGGNLILLTATVNPFPGMPDFGTVTFNEEGTAFSDGIDIPLGADGQAFYTWATTTSTPTGPHLLCAQSSGAAGFLPSSDTETVTLDAASLQPQVASIGLNGNLPGFMTPGGQGQNSRIVNFVVNFDRPVQLDLPGAFTLSLHTLNVIYDGVAYPEGYDAATFPLPTLTATPSNGNRTWTITFSGNSAITGQDGYNSLPDGVFDFTVHGANVHPQGSPGVNMGGDNTATFHSLFGDTTAPTAVPNGSGGTDYTAVVNSGDNLSFRGAFNNATNYRPYLDVNGSGSINSGDNLQFRGNFNHTLKWTV